LDDDHGYDGGGCQYHHHGCDDGDVRERGCVTLNHDDDVKKDSFQYRWRLSFF